MRRLRHVTSIAACASLALGLAACGEKKINTGKLESKLKEGISKQFGIKVSKVDCPKDVKAKKGNTFTCRAHAASGQVQKFTVTQDDDQGHVHYAPAA
jgi:hypothetical protein